MLRTIDDLHGPAGRLEALLHEGGPDAPYSAVVAHPHPLFGGTMHNKVVYHAMKAFHAFGLPVLRFNFRGAGLSEGVHDQGVGEREDLRAALAWLEKAFDGRPILSAGFSFGASVSLRTCCGDTRVKGIAALGLPVHAEGRDYHYRFLSGCLQPKLVINGTADKYAPPEQVEAVMAAATPPAKLVLVPEADHFFVGKLDQVQTALSAWLEEQFLLSPLTTSQ
jgi:alpha/beta superfamily hydrolase